MILRFTKKIPNQRIGSILKESTLESTLESIALFSRNASRGGGVLWVDPRMEESREYGS